MTFMLHVNRLSHKRADRDVWVIRQGRRVRYARRVVCEVPVRTVYRGDHGRQPRAFLRGDGVVRIVDRVARIQAA